MWFPNRSGTNRPVQAQKQARSLKFWIYKVVHYRCSENKDADQLRSYCEADLRLCFRLLLRRLIYLLFTHLFIICFFVLRFNVPVNNFSVMSGRSQCFQGINQYCGELMCLAQRHSTVPCVGIEPGPLDSE